MSKRVRHQKSQSVKPYYPGVKPKRTLLDKIPTPMDKVGAPMDKVGAPIRKVRKLFKGVRAPLDRIPKVI